MYINKLSREVIVMKNSSTLKKNAVLTLVILSIMVVFAGCSTKTNLAENLTSTTEIPNPPERTAELYGQVKSIVGNEITLLLAEFTVTTPLTEDEKAKKKSEMSQLSAEERKSLKESQMKYTGETATVIIPVGTPIIIGSSNGAEQIPAEKSLSDIYSGIIVRIWLDQGGVGTDKTSEYVRIIQSQ
jgi:ABC-type Fe3+-hydroxamate transport system substrate-binding protein